MVVKPKVRGFICTTAHPAGCREMVRGQIEYVKERSAGESAEKKPPFKKVLVIGASMGYGLSSRITAAYLGGAATIGVIFDKQGEGSRTGTAGWYNTAAFEEFARKDGLYAKTINGDAFSRGIKEEVISLIKKDLGKVDAVIYSLAAPRRTCEDGTVYNSSIKTIGEEYSNKTIDFKNKKITPATVSPASEEEIASTVKVMGGEDWKDWIKALYEADAIENDAVTVAYSYIGPELTFPLYHKGTIGRAKEHLAKTADEISSLFGGIKGYVSINKAVVTQASAAIPVVPLYISILFKVMKEKGLHEGCIEQICRMFSEKFKDGSAVIDDLGFIRLDDLEMRSDVQKETSALWKKITDENIDECSDVDGYSRDFFNLFGFEVKNVDYEADVEI